MSAPATTPATWAPRIFIDPDDPSPLVADAIALTRAIGDGWWTTYGDVATVIATPAHARGLSAALSAVQPNGYPGDTSCWCLPWEKLRGFDGRARSRENGGWVAERNAHDDLLLTSQNCAVLDGVADPARRIPLADLKALWASR